MIRCTACADVEGPFGLDRDGTFTCEPCLDAQKVAGLRRGHTAPVVRPDVPRQDAAARW